MDIFEEIEIQADKEHDTLFSGLRVEVKSLKDNSDYVKCPRCWHYHVVKNNYLDICDRCCRVLIDAFPDCTFTSGVIENWKQQGILK